MERGDRNVSTTIDERVVEMRFDNRQFENNIKDSITSLDELKKNSNLTGQDRIIEICKLLDGDMYINAIGGKKLYDRGAFAKQGTELRFLESESLIYPQFGNEFVPNLSIIDVLMFNSLDDVKEMLTRYKLKE